MQEAVESTGRAYADDYKFWGALQEFAISRSIALIVIHHDRKPNGNGGNVLDTVSGTRAITGAADHVWLLERNKETGISTLKVIGRDLDEKSIQFSRDIDGKLRAVETPVLDAVARIDQRVRARKMREDGASFAAIAKALGIGKSTAERWCQDHGRLALKASNARPSHFPFPPYPPPLAGRSGVVVLRGAPRAVPQYGTNKKTAARRTSETNACPIDRPTSSHSWLCLLDTWRSSRPILWDGAGRCSSGRRETDDDGSRAQPPRPALHRLVGAAE